MNVRLPICVGVLVAMYLASVALNLFTAFVPSAFGPFTESDFDRFSQMYPGPSTSEEPARGKVTIISTNVVEHPAANQSTDILITDR